MVSTVAMASRWTWISVFGIAWMSSRACCLVISAAVLCLPFAILQDVPVLGGYSAGILFPCNE